MRIGIPAEIRPGETRVSATPDTIRKLRSAGHSVVVQAHAGIAAGIGDADMEQAGADIAASPADVYSRSDIVLKVRGPAASEFPLLRRGLVLIGQLSPHNDAAPNSLAATGVTAFAMELVPRVTRAQAMDVLSSQANIAGYKAVIGGAHE